MRIAGCGVILAPNLLNDMKDFHKEIKEPLNQLTGKWEIISLRF